MNRRRVLRLLSAGTVGLAAGHELDLERLLWVPGRKTIFIPPVRLPELQKFVITGSFVAEGWSRRSAIAFADEMFECYATFDGVFAPEPPVRLRARSRFDAAKGES